MTNHPKRPRDPVRPTLPSTGPGVILLGQVATELPAIDIACNRCARRSRMRTDRLVAAHGAGTPIPVLLRVIAADCPRMQAAQIHDVCGVHLPQLSGQV